ncbi:hypothetical protein RAC89_13980 [Paenibacillus sp. GD4]|nr:DUF445 family protein [Paenibacillus sp. GD4]MDQ1911537.1 hypothetical protein [Paenibacillus sp. GD4]
MAHRLTGIGHAEKQLYSDEVKNALQMISERLVEQIPVEQAVAFAESEIRTKLETLDTRKAIEFVMEQVLAKEYDEKAFDFVLDVAEQFVFRDETRDRLGAMASQAIGQMQTGGFMGFALNAFAGFLSEDKLGSMIQQFILKALMDLRRQGDSNRRAILHAVRGKSAADLGGSGAAGDDWRVEGKTARRMEFERAIAQPCHAFEGKGSGMDPTTIFGFRSAAAGADRRSSRKMSRY